MIQQYDLTGRTARCSCGKTQPSSPDLAFFEYRGEGSRLADRACNHCGYFDTAHTEEVSSLPHNSLICNNFEPRGDFGFDAFYCGHGGWD